jgi:hypothetical protein
VLIPVFIEPSFNLFHAADAHVYPLKCYESLTKLGFVSLWWKYEWESTNRPQIDIKRKIFDIWTWGKTFISWHILHQHWYTCPIPLLVRWIPQHRSLLTVASAISALQFQPLRHQRSLCQPAVNHFTQETRPNMNRKHFFALSPFAHKKRTTERTCKSTWVVNILYTINRPSSWDTGHHTECKIRGFLEYDTSWLISRLLNIQGPLHPEIFCKTLPD